MITSIIELILIVLLLIKLIFKEKKSSKRTFKEEAINQDIDFDNIFNSSFHSKEIYDELKVKCHPDRFVHDAELQTIAENLFQEITRNKNNSKRLHELKNEAMHQLNLKF
jgi:hypothetical protein